MAELKSNCSPGGVGLKVFQAAKKIRDDAATGGKSVLQTVAWVQTIHGEVFTIIVRKGGID